MFGLSVLQISAVSLLVLVGASAGSYAFGYQRGSFQALLDAEKAQTAAVTKAAAEARALGIAEGAITITAGQHFADVQTRIVNRVIIRIQTVDHFIPMEVSAACAIPLSAIQLLNAAAADSDDPAAAFPVNPGQSSSDTANTDLAALAANVVENYGKFHEVRAQLIALQKWAADQRALHP